MLGLPVQGYVLSTQEWVPFRGRPPSVGIRDEVGNWKDVDINQEMGLARTHDHSVHRTETDHQLSAHEVPFQRGCQPWMPGRDKGFPCGGGCIEHVATHGPCLPGTGRAVLRL